MQLRRPTHKCYPALSQADLFEFACGHVGLTEVDNVAVLKRRLLPALAELEEIGFLQPLSAPQRFVKVKAGQWRIVLEAARTEAPAAIAEPVSEAVSDPATLLALEFYRLWDPTQTTTPGPRDREQAQALLTRLSDANTALVVIGYLVQVTRQNWPECRSLSGALQKYLGDALKLHEDFERRAAQRHAAEQQREQERQERQARQTEEQEASERWESLSAEQQQSIRERVLASLEGRFAPEAFIRRLCLDQLRAGLENPR